MVDQQLHDVCFNSSNFLRKENHGFEPKGGPATNQTLVIYFVFVKCVIKQLDKPSNVYQMFESKFDVVDNVYQMFNENLMIIQIFNQMLDLNCDHVFKYSANLGSATS